MTNKDDKYHLLTLLDADGHYTDVINFPISEYTTTYPGVVIIYSQEITELEYTILFREIYKDGIH